MTIVRADRTDEAPVRDTRADKVKVGDVHRGGHIVTEVRMDDDYAHITLDNGNTMMLYVDDPISIRTKADHTAWTPTSEQIARNAIAANQSLGMARKQAARCRRRSDAASRASIPTGRPRSR